MGCMFSCCDKPVKNDASDRITTVPVSLPTITERLSSSDKPPVDTAGLQFSLLEPANEHIVTCNNMAMGDSSSIMNLYNKYVNIDMGQISAEGTEQLCSDLELNPEDFRVLVLAYSLGAQVMCRFTEEEFVKGCEKHGITSLQSMKQAIPKLLNNIEKSFADFYRWTYKFALDVETGQRTLATEMAISLWKLVFTQNYPTILDRWLAYLESNTTLKGISKDTWDMFLIFVDQVGDDLESYDDSEAWPSLLDDFVEHELSKSHPDSNSVAC